MSKYILEFTESYVGHGVHALYCWRSDRLSPAGWILFNRYRDGSEKIQSRTRIDIVLAHVVGSKQSDIVEAIIGRMQEECDVIHTPVATDTCTESVMTACGFVHDAAGMDWVWRKPVKPRLEAGGQTDLTLATLLGWRNAQHEQNGESKIVVALPPGGTELRPVPAYSTDRSLALGLIVELAERVNLDYNWWKFKGLYSCGVRSGDQTGEFKDEDTSPWYNHLNLAICHALINYLQRLRIAKHARKEAELSENLKDQIKEMQTPVE